MPADSELCSYLQTLGLGTYGTDLFAGECPGSVANAIVLTIYPGSMPEGACGADGLNLVKPRLQVRVRNTDEATALSKAEAVAVALSKIGSAGAVTISSVRYRAVTVLQSPGLLFRDGNDRPNYGFNVECEKASS